MLRTDTYYELRLLHSTLSGKFIQHLRCRGLDSPKLASFFCTICIWSLWTCRWMCLWCVSLVFVDCTTVFLIASQKWLKKADLFREKLVKRISISVLQLCILFLFFKINYSKKVRGRQIFSIKCLTNFFVHEIFSVWPVEIKHKLFIGQNSFFLSLPLKKNHNKY